MSTSPVQNALDALSPAARARIVDVALRIRGVLLAGRRFSCPCCGSSFRGFVGRWGVLRTNRDGYCPSCNAKARHRRAWIWLEHQLSTLGGDEAKILDVAPWASFARSARRHGLDYLGLDIDRTPSTDLVADVTNMPLASDVFDVVMCVHVLEHVDDDLAAIRELFRVVKPGGVVGVSVPLREGATIEDPRITDPDERAAVFGERGHVRWYGVDLRDRLTDAGFEVRIDPADAIPDDDRDRYGLRSDDHIFRCVKRL